jgi:hypothetical protein
MGFGHLVARILWAVYQPMMQNIKHLRQVFMVSIALGEVFERTSVFGFTLSLAVLAIFRGAMILRAHNCVTCYRETRKLLSLLKLAVLRECK